jgi:protein CpxP
MKKGILVTLLFAGIVFGTYAQNAKPAHKEKPLYENRGPRQGGGFTAEERAEVYAKRMQKNLNLTDEQYKKVLAINIEQAKKQEELRAAHKAEMIATHEKMKANRLDLFNKYESILTSEQLKNFKEVQEKHKTEMKKGRKERRGKR